MSKSKLASFEYYRTPEGTIYHGDALDVMRLMPDESVQCVVSSPPYWSLRDYGVYGQIGLEKTPEEYITKIVEIFREVRRVLRSDGTLWLNLGSSYFGSGKDDMMELREDLTLEEIGYVLQELSKTFFILEET